MWLRHAEKLAHVAHSKTFHTSHGVAHIAYFCAVMAEGHGIYAVIGGIMVMFSFVSFLVDGSN